MCNCKNVNIGTYKNTILMNPPWKLNGIPVQIDKCLEAEIKHLWKNGIVTMASCCGHNTMDASIAVRRDSVKKMVKLGYTKINNPCKDGCKWIFRPKWEM